jgi:hypothetical protein
MMIRTANPRRMDVQHAADDLRSRTLAGIQRPLDRLIYLASTRDYNTGIYHHDGLAARYTPTVACEALAGCHREVFQELLACSVKDLVIQIEGYMCSAGISASEFLTSWKRLEPYRVAVPVETEPLSSEFLFCNLKAALAILEGRQHPRPTVPAAWPRP